MIFVDRREELAALRSAVDHGPSLIRLFGRRRLGKTELLVRLCQERNGVYLLADEAESSLQVQSLSDQLSRALSQPPVPTPTWDAFLGQLEQLGPRVVVIDEFQRLLKRPHAAESRLQHQWDVGFSKRGPSIVLCGSSVGMMRRLTRRPSAPLYGRLAADLQLRPLGFASVRLLHHGLPEQDRVRRFAVFGGTPFYQQFAVGRSLEVTVRSAFLSRGAPLIDEPLNLLRMEVSTPDRYHSILQAIGGGTHDLAALESALQVPSGRLSPYIALLRDELSLIKAETPVGGGRRRGRYIFSDPFFAFYYRFIPRVRPLVESGNASLALDTIRQGLEAHVGLMFERVAAEALRALNGTVWKGVPIEFEELGRWWNRQGMEVDLVARGGPEILVGEVKWGSGPLKLAALWALEGKARLLEGTGRRPVRLVFVARDGFTQAMQRAARERGAVLLDLADLSSIVARAGKKR